MVLDLVLEIVLVLVLALHRLKSSLDFGKIRFGAFLVFLVVHIDVDVQSDLPGVVSITIILSFSFAVLLGPA